MNNMNEDQKEPYEAAVRGRGTDPNKMVDMSGCEGVVLEAGGLRQAGIDDPDILSDMSDDEEGPASNNDILFSGNKTAKEMLVKKGFNHDIVSLMSNETAASIHSTLFSGDKTAKKKLVKKGMNSDIVSVMSDEGAANIYDILFSGDKTAKKKLLKKGFDPDIVSLMSDDTAASIHSTLFSEETL